MTTLTRALGAVLLALGVVAYLVRYVVRGSGIDYGASPTALIPFLLGLVVLVLGVLAGRSALHRHAIHGALVIAALGALAPLGNVVQLPAVLSGEPVVHPGAVVASTVTVLLCAAYVAAGICSFVAARKARGTAGAPPPRP